MRRLSIFRWPGGKGNFLGRLLPLIPQGGRPYTEAYLGAGHVLLNRPPAPVEAANDLDGRIVGLFRLLQDREAYEALRHRIRFTPYARAEFARALEILRAEAQGEAVPPLDLAWAFLVAHGQGFGGWAANVGNWGRALTGTSRGAGPVAKWASLPDRLERVRERILRVQLDQRDALDFLRYWDTPEAVHYVDPPYHPDTVRRGYYRHNADHEHHRRLVEVLLGLEGAVVLSGYQHPVYAPLEEAGWRRLDFPTASRMAGRTRVSGMRGQGAALAKVPRVESVWLNPKAQGLLHPHVLSL